MRMLSFPIFSKSQQPLAREISVILIVKILLLLLLWWLFFQVPESRRIHTPQVSTHVVGATNVVLPPAKESSP